MINVTDKCKIIRSHKGFKRVSTFKWYYTMLSKLKAIDLHDDYMKIFEQEKRR